MDLSITIISAIAFVAGFQFVYGFLKAWRKDKKQAPPPIGYVEKISVSEDGNQTFFSVVITDPDYFDIIREGKKQGRMIDCETRKAH